MISEDILKSRVKWPGLQTFGSFVLSATPPGALPDYKKLNLLDIPALVPNIWVYDLRNFAADGRLLVNFAGERFTERHKATLIGRVMQEVWQTDPAADKLIRHYTEAIKGKRVSHTERSARFLLADKSERFQFSETLFFPCASDGSNVDWAIGCAHHVINLESDVEVFEYLN